MGVVHVVEMVHGVSDGLLAVHGVDVGNKWGMCRRVVPIGFATKVRFSVEPLQVLPPLSDAGYVI